MRRPFFRRAKKKRLATRQPFFPSLMFSQLLAMASTAVSTTTVEPTAATAVESATTAAVEATATAAVEAVAPP